VHFLLSSSVNKPQLIVIAVALMASHTSNWFYEIGQRCVVIIVPVERLISSNHMVYAVGFDYTRKLLPHSHAVLISVLLSV